MRARSERKLLSRLLVSLSPKIARYPTYVLSGLSLSRGEKLLSIKLRGKKLIRNLNLRDRTTGSNIYLTGFTTFLVYRYTGASAAVNTWDQQEDDRGSGSLLRVLGKGTTSLEHN